MNLIRLEDSVSGPLKLNRKPLCRNSLLHYVFIANDDGSYLCYKEGLELSEELERKLSELFVQGKVYVEGNDAKRFYCYEIDLIMAIV